MGNKVALLRTHPEGGTMALQFIIGGSGTGKSHRAYERIIREAQRCPEVLYYIIVPEQFTMQTQKTVVEMSPGGGILNIDVVSLTRLAYRVFEETGGDSLTMLDDIGKSMVIRKLAAQKEKDYPYLGSQMRKPGCLDEVKSLISEFMQYDISPEDTAGLAERAAERTLLSLKLRDLSRLYREFLDYLKDRYMTGEGVMEELAAAIEKSQRLKGSVVLLDGFTGFTPVQQKVLRALLAACRDMTVTVTMDEGERKNTAWSLFSMSRRMIKQLTSLTRDISEPVILKGGEKTRFSEAPALDFLEKNLFRYNGRSFNGEPENIRMFVAANPADEMEETARRICTFVRKEGLKYGDMAVITGNMEEYAPAARQAFEGAGIPFFIDETKSILENPLVEYLRASLELIDKSFSYESVFRYLRSGLTDITSEETDRLENYARALGIRSFKRWNEKWVRVYRGQDPAEMLKLNEARERFLSEVSELREGLSGSSTVEDYCTQLFAFLRRNRIQEKVNAAKISFGEAGDRAREKEYAQVYRIVIDLFDRMVAIMGNEKMSRSEFIKVLDTGLGKAKVALIPPGQDQVLVGDMERTRLRDVSVLFFVGVNEGNIPKNVSSGGMLSEADRDYLAEEGIELAPDPKEQMNIQRFYLYLNLTKPRKQLILSYSCANQKGEALRSAYLIGNLMNLYPALSVKKAGKEEDLLPERPGMGLMFLAREMPFEEGEMSPETEELLRWYLRNKDFRTSAEKLVEASFMKAPSGRIQSTVAKALYGDVPLNGSTRLERFAACACAHFLRYGLSLKERKEYEFNSADLGNLVHSVLEYFEKELASAGLSLRTVDDETRDSLLDRCLDTAAADYGNTILKSSARNAWMVERARKILHRTVWALTQQLKWGQFEPEGVEIAFQGGRIDRLDTMVDKEKVYVKVIDYKTGNTTFELLKLYHGLQIQLVLYLDAAMQIEKTRHPDKEVIPAGIFYYNVKDPVMEGSLYDAPGEIEDQILKTLRMNGLVTSDTDVIRAMDSSFVSLPVSVSLKTGELDSRSRNHAASPEEFDLMVRYVKEMSRENRGRILDGETAAHPYRMQQETPCDYCPYKGSCGFDRGIRGYSYKDIRKIDNSGLWKLMEEKSGDGVDQ